MTRQTARRLGIALLLAVVTGYLATITHALGDDLHSTTRIVLFVLLWTVGLVALFLLVRAWRSLARDSAENTPD